jgi:DNA-directed RNA polymerase specialized sigma24 family protein
VVEAIDACFGRMNDVIRELALLVWVEGHTFVEAATISGMKEDAVRKRLTRARPALQRCLELRGVVGCES